MDDWYQVSRQDIVQHGGAGLFRYYPSLGYILKAVYPLHPWQLSLFSSKKALQYRERSEDSVIKQLDSLEEKLGIQQVHYSLWCGEVWCCAVWCGAAAMMWGLGAVPDLGKITEIR